MLATANMDGQLDRDLRGSCLPSDFDRGVHHVFDQPDQLFLGQGLDQNTELAWLPDSLAWLVGVYLAGM